MGAPDQVVIVPHGLRPPFPVRGMAASKPARTNQPGKAERGAVGADGVLEDD